MEDLRTEDLGGEQKIIGKGVQEILEDYLFEKATNDILQDAEKKVSDFITENTTGSFEIDTKLLHVQENDIRLSMTIIKNGIDYNFLVKGKKYEK